PIHVEAFRNDAAGDLGEAERQRLVDAVAIDRKARGPAHPLVMPWRLLIPLIDEGKPERRGNDDRLQRETCRAAQLFRQLTAHRIDDVDLAACERCETR